MQNQTIFEYLYPTYKITKPIRLIELFAGIGSQAKALKNLGANFETYKVVEFDKYAIASYNAVHGTNFATSDITKIHAQDLEIVDTAHFTYLLTYLLFPLPRFKPSRKPKRHDKRKPNKERVTLGSRTHTRRVQRQLTTNTFNGKCATSNRPKKY